MVLVASFQRQGSERNISFPLWLLIRDAQIDPVRHVVVHESGPNDAPCNDAASEERNGDIETNEHTRADECGRPLEVPTPILNVESGIVIVAPDIEPSEDVPLIVRSACVSVCYLYQEFLTSPREYRWRIAKQHARPERQQMQWRDPSSSS